MAYTAAQVITQAQRFLIDIDDAAYSDDMLTYLNEGCRRFASETHCCQSYVLISNITDSSIPYLVIRNAIDTIITPGSTEGILFVSKVLPMLGDNWTPLPKAPMSEMKAFLATDVTIPTRYFLYAEAIHFDVEEGVSMNSGAGISFRLWCSYIPADLTATSDLLIIPDEWVHAIVKYMVFCCHIADRSAALANGAYAEFEAIKQAAANVYISQIERIPGAVQ